MAAPSYTTDLTDITQAESITGWTEPTGFTAGAIAAETDYWIQNPGSGTTHCISKSMGASASFTSGMIYDKGSNTVISSPGAFMQWVVFSAPNALASQSGGGIQFLIGSANSAYRQYYVRGSDTYTYGGWECIPIDPTITPSSNVGTPAAANLSCFGCNANGAGIAAVSKGNPLGVDALRYGRCEIRVANGSVGDGYATFAGMAANNDLETNRWGLFQAIRGGYLYQGLMTLGYGNAVDFRDSNKNISIANTQWVVSSFNTIQVVNASSTVAWTAISISALGSTSRGDLTVTENANVNFDTCTFTDMGAFTFLSGSSVTGTTFRRCLTVSANSSNLQSSTFTGYQGASNTSALIWGDNIDTNGKLDSCEFVHGSIANNCHGLQLANQSLSSVTLTNVTFSGYSTANGNPNSAIHVLKSSGSLTINITGGTTPSILTEGATVTVVSGAVDLAVHVSNTAGSNVENAIVILKAADGTGPFPYQESVTIVNTGTNANVHHVGHGMATLDKVLINGASHWQNNGVFELTKISDDYYSYTMPSAPGSDPTGTITATFVALFGNTDVTGNITTSRVYPSGQNVTGWVRKSSSAPYYITSPLTGMVNNTTGYTGSAILIPDQ